MPAGAEYPILRAGLSARVENSPCGTRSSYSSFRNWGLSFQVKTPPMGDGGQIVQSADIPHIFGQIIGVFLQCVKPKYLIMTINIQFERMPFSESMTEYMITKLHKLGEKYAWIVNANVFFKKENGPSGNGKICEIELGMPGPKIFASSRDTNFELAAKETTLEIEKQLQKRKAVLKAR